MNIHKKLHNIFSKIELLLREKAYNNEAYYHIYSNLVLPIRMMCFNPPSRVFGGGSYFQRVHDCMNRFVQESDKTNSLYVKNLQKEFKRCFLLYNLLPEEYFWYDFAHKSHKERAQFLSDIDRFRYCQKAMSMKAFEELRNKKIFYNLTKAFFKREVCFIEDERDLAVFLDFMRKHESAFIKPMDGTYGANAEIIRSGKDLQGIFYRLQKEGKWIVEGLIVQSEKTAQWNTSSVNTVRIPSFRMESGIIIIQPFIRTGRAGAIIDNAGGGGIFAAIDPDTGIIVSEGYSESLNKSFEIHPDSHIKYIGWQLPDWDNLKELARAIHLSLPDIHKYVGFDFAYTDRGWVLIEGNWGQFVGQIPTKHGVRNEVKKLLLGGCN